MIAAPLVQKPPRRAQHTQKLGADMLRRVYVDGRHHWWKDGAQTLCGLPTSNTDVTKPGRVECGPCTQIAGVLIDQEQHYE